MMFQTQEEDEYVSKGDNKPPVSREALLALFRRENKILKEVLEAFDAMPSVKRKDRLNASDTILEICGRILDEPGWYTSRFLKSLIKPVEQLRLDMQNLRRELLMDEQRVSVKKPNIDARGKCMVYLALFQREGHDLKKWENLLKNLDRHCIGRPVYSSERDVIAFIHSKSDQSREAYVKLYVEEKMIIGSDFGQRKDRLGQPLLNLAQGAVSIDHIEELVHMHTSYYFYQQKELVLCDKQDRS